MESEGEKQRVEASYLMIEKTERRRGVLGGPGGGTVPSQYQPMEVERTKNTKEGESSSKVRGALVMLPRGGTIQRGPTAARKMSRGEKRKQKDRRRRVHTG